jgi:hypothetical protein
MSDLGPCSRRKPNLFQGRLSLRLAVRFRQCRRFCSAKIATHSIMMPLREKHPLESSSLAAFCSSGLSRSTKPSCLPPARKSLQLRLFQWKRSSTRLRQATQLHSCSLPRSPVGSPRLATRRGTGKPHSKPLTSKATTRIRVPRSLSEIEFLPFRINDL